MILNWEKSFTGQSAVLVERTPIKGPMLGGIAYKKANDVEWVRASFGGEWTGFEPYLSLWVKEQKKATGLIVLMHAYPRDAGISTLPDVCIRRAEWREPLAVQEFSIADDKRLYVQDNLPVQCVLRFFHSAEIGIDQLMERTSRILAAGISFTEVSRTDRSEVTFEFCNGLSSYKFSFALGGLSSIALEEIVREWVEYAQALEMRHICFPDDGIQIAYRESLWEQTARYDNVR